MAGPSDPLASLPGHLAGKAGLILGSATEHSIAAGCASHFAQAGASLVATYLNDAARPYVEAATRSLPSVLLLTCDVRQPGSMEAVFEAVRVRFDRLDFLLHAVAFAPRDDLHGRVTDCSAAGFALAMDVSCHFNELLARRAAEAPERTQVSIDDVGAVAAFLVGDGAKMITGTVIPVDGAQHVLA